MYPRVCAGILVLIACLPIAAHAHRSVLCDGRAKVRVYLKTMLQIKSLVPLTGVHVETKQPEDFLQHDESNRNRLFRLYAAHMKGDHVTLHLNTARDHQCIVTVVKTTKKADTIVTIDFPQTHADKLSLLSPKLRASPIRQIWMAQWGNGHDDPVPTATCTTLDDTLNTSIAPGTSTTLAKRCSVDGFVAYTYTLTNTSATTLSFAAHGFQPPISAQSATAPAPRMPVSANLTDIHGKRHDGLVRPGEQVCLHVVYKAKRRGR